MISLTLLLDLLLNYNIYFFRSVASTYAPSSVSNSVLRSAAPNFFPVATQTLPLPHIPSQPAMIVPSSFDMLGYAGDLLVFLYGKIKCI